MIYRNLETLPPRILFKPTQVCAGPKTSRMYAGWLMMIFLPRNFSLAKWVRQHFVNRICPMRYCVDRRSVLGWVGRLRRKLLPCEDFQLPVCDPICEKWSVCHSESGSMNIGTGIVRYGTAQLSHPTPYGATLVFRGENIWLEEKGLTAGRANLLSYMWDDDDALPESIIIQPSCMYVVPIWHPIQETQPLGSEHHLHPDWVAWMLSTNSVQLLLKISFGPTASLFHYCASTFLLWTRICSKLDSLQVLLRGSSEETNIQSQVLQRFYSKQLADPKVPHYCSSASEKQCSEGIMYQARSSENFTKKVDGR